VLVLVDFQRKAGDQKKAGDQRPDFYILTGEDWKNVIDETGFIQKGWGRMREDGIFEYTDGFKGLNVSPKMVQKYGEQWDKIRAMLKLKFAAHRS
jgi:hypothetical protein